LARIERIMATSNSGQKGGKEGCKSKNDNEQTQAHETLGHLTAAAAEHYLRPIPT
jgi:hypothetical protein